MLYAVLVLALVGLDQLVKFLVRAYIPLGGDVPFLPHILQLTYVQNTGAAFSIFSQHTWILTVVSLVVSVALAVLLLKKVFPHPLAMLTLSLVLAGAVGNLIDRVAFGYLLTQDRAVLCDDTGAAHAVLKRLGKEQRWRENGGRSSLLYTLTDSG